MSHLDLTGEDMSTDKSEIKRERAFTAKSYIDQRNNIIGNLQRITNRYNYEQPDRRNQGLIRRLMAENVEKYFDDALSRFKDIAPDFSEIRIANTKKDTEKQQAAIYAKLQNHLIFLNDLAPVVKAICDLQEFLLENNLSDETTKNLTTAITKLGKLRSSLENLKIQHNDTFQKAKFNAYLGSGLIIFGMIVFIALPLILATVYPSALGIGLLAGATFFTGSYVIGISKVEKNANVNRQRLFVEMTEKKMQNMELDYPQLSMSRTL